MSNAAAPPTDLPTEDHRVRSFMRVLVSVIGITLLLPGMAQAAPPSSMRTYVSGLGNDNNGCTVNSPCKTFQRALAMTIAGGEIFVLNSANYGAVTIGKAVTIASEGAVAGVLATGGVAIAINAGVNDVVNLRGLSIDGGNTGTIGIQFTSGQSLNIQRSAIRNFTNSGINFAPTAGTSALFVADTLVTNNGNNGILVAPSGSGGVKGALSRVVASGNGLASNGLGIFVYGGNSSGAVNLTLTDTVVNNNYYGVAVGASAGMVRNSTVSNNVVGIRADQAAIIRVGQSTVTANGIGWQATNGGLLQSFGNNNVSGNATDGTLTSTLTLQ
jgi:hypothetical protein